MPYANLATAGEDTHNADAVRTAKKNESCGEATPWEADQPGRAGGAVRCSQGDFVSVKVIAPLERGKG